MGIERLPPDAVNPHGPSAPSEDGSNLEDTSNGSYPTYRWLLAWAVLILVLFLLNKSRIGHLIIYYSLVLMLLFLIVTQYKWFVGVLAPFGSLGPGLQVNGQQVVTTNDTEEKRPPDATN